MFAVRILEPELKPQTRLVLFGLFSAPLTRRLIPGEVFFIRELQVLLWILII